MKRVDFGTIQRIDGSKGFPAKYKITFAKSGVLDYLHSDGSISKEAKLPEELFKDDTLDSLRGAPITNEHPEGFVDGNNSSSLVKGTVLSVEVKDNSHLEGAGSIFDSSLIKEIEDGDKKEVSIGFMARVDNTPGELNGVKYDRSQRDIKINHLAICPSGRAGSEVAIHNDSKNDFAVQRTDSVQKEFDKMSDNKNTKYDALLKKMDDLKNVFAGLMGKKTEKKTDVQDIETAMQKLAELTEEFKIAQENKEPVDSIQQLQQEKQKIVALEAQVAGLNQVIEEMKANLEAVMSPESQDERLESRSKIIDVGTALIKDFKSEGKKNNEMMIEVINEILPMEDGSKLTTDSKDYLIEARYEAAAEVARQRSMISAPSRRKGPKTEIVDEAKIIELRNNRLDQFERNREKVAGGKE